MAEILVAVCTLNPNAEKFKRVITSIINQTYRNYRLVVIDNASTYFPGDLLKDVKCEVYLERNQGNSFARHAAISKWHGEELLIFVDDDNILDDTYFEKAIESRRLFPDWGAYGGQQYPSENLPSSKLTRAMFPYLGIRSLGTTVIERDATMTWNELEPIGAGMCLSKDVVKRFLDISLREQSGYFSLGRKGKGLLSGEDSFIARQASPLKLKYGYNPGLKLEHLISPKRLGILYLCRLMFAYGRSDVILDSALGIEPSYPYPRTMIQAFRNYFWQVSKSRAGFIIGMRQLGIYTESKVFSNVFLK